MKTVILLLLISLSAHAIAETLFYDGFESGALDQTNPYGFSWSTPNRTSVVTMNPTCGSLSAGSAAILYDGSPKCEGPIADVDWQAYSGNNSLRFHYPANQPWTEQRFNLGSPVKDVWISFMLRVPRNFSYGESGGPNKLFALWMDGYSQHGDGSTVWLTMWDQNTSDASVAYTFSRGGYTSSTAMRGYKTFITTEDRGRWMRLIIHARAETAPGKSDGVIQTFRKWVGSPDLEQLHDGKNLAIKIPDDGPGGFQRGYVLGWANAAYSSDTDWLIDDFVVSTTPLLNQPKPIESLSID